MGSTAEQKLPLPFNLPVDALVLVCPMIAASILVYMENRSDGVKQLLKRSFDFKRRDIISNCLYPERIVKTRFNCA